MYWVTNSSGKKDAMLTFAFFSFWVVTLNILLASIGTITYNGNSINFVPIDAASMTAYLGATFTAYVTRKWTDKRFHHKKQTEQVEEELPTQPGV